MSHFAVIVIGPDPEKQMAPYHEYECTGMNDKYVQDIDNTEEFLEEMKTNTITKVKDPDGKLHDPWGDQFYRDPTPEEEEKIGPIGSTGCAGGMQYSSRDWGDGKGYRAKVREVPEGWEEVLLQAADSMTIEEYIKREVGTPIVLYGEEPNTMLEEYKWGYVQMDKDGGIHKVIRRTNPNAKWDWYVMGGRYRGFFPIKPEATTAAVGQAGVFNNDAEPGTADQLLFKDLDLDRAYAEAEAQANLTFDDWEELFKEHGKAKSWKDVCPSGDNPTKEELEKAREVYNAQPLVKAVKEHGTFSRWFFDCPIDVIGFSRKAYVRRQRDQAIVSFAVIKDGEWYERGEMGWWACVTDEKDRDAWNREFNSLLQGLDPDTLITAYDCHI